MAMKKKTRNKKQDKTTEEGNSVGRLYPLLGCTHVNDQVTQLALLILSSISSMWLFLEATELFFVVGGDSGAFCLISGQQVGYFPNEKLFSIRKVFIRDVL